MDTGDVTRIFFRPWMGRIFILGWLSDVHVKMKGFVRSNV